MIEHRAMTLLAGLWSATACDPAAPSRAPDLGAGSPPPIVETVLRSSVSGLTTPDTRIIETAETWAATWEEIHANLDPKPPIPAVDFRTTALVLDALGNVADGRTTRIDAVEAVEGGVVVRTTIETPGPTCAIPAVITHPVHVVRVRRPLVASLVKVERIRAVFDCG
ncbi:MAG TPA: hypothetical protein VGA42_08655 [Gemmatimonadales bacterium]